MISSLDMIRDLATKLLLMHLEHWHSNNHLASNTRYRNDINSSKDDVY